MADGGKVIIKIDGDSDGFKKAMGGIGKIAGTAFKGIAVGAGAAATAIGAIGTAAVKSYEDFEQLSGGAKKIFDEIDYSKIKADADEAFKTMQISANQYLQLMTTVGANFASTLGDEKGYEVAKSGMKAISDFATGTGRDIDELSQKYQMITKSTSSYQSIADQFAGVLPATSEQFLKQAQAAGLLEKKYKKLTAVPIAQYQEAVTQMLAKGVDALGLTDNAANEAATTLSGSINMFKASWDNLMTGLADPSQDLDALIDNVINSAMAVLDNLEPVIDSVLDSLPIMLETLGTKILDTLPELINSLLPQLADCASQLIGALCSALAENAESLGETAITVLMTLVDTFLDNLLLLVDTALVLIETLAEGLAQAAPQLVPAVVDTVLKIVDTLLDNIDMLVDVSIELILALAEGLIVALPQLAARIPEIVIKIVSAIVENAPRIKEAAEQLISMLWDGLINSFASYFSSWGQIIYDNIVQPIRLKWEEIKQAGAYLLEGLWNGIGDKVGWLKDNVTGVIDQIKSWFTGKDGFDERSPSKWSEMVFAYVIDGGVNGIKKRKSKLIDAFKSLTADSRTEVEKVLAESNKTVLEGERKYFEEKERLEKEEAEKEYKQKLANAKDAKAREKIKQEYVLKEQEAANKKYLEGLKEAADKERELYEAMLKDMENEKKKVLDTLTSLAEEAYDKLEDVYDAQNDFADKLKDYGSLYVENKIIGGEDEEYTYYTLADIEKQKKDLEKYSENIKKVKERGVLPKTLLEELRGMSVEEGMRFTDILLNSNDEDFNKYLKDWKEREDKADEIATDLYADDFKEAEEEIKKSFEDLPDDFLEIGENAGKNFSDSFIQAFKEKREEIRAEINNAIASLFPSVDASASGDVSNTTYSPTYNILARGEGPRSWMWEVKQFDLVQRLMGGY